MTRRVQVRSVPEEAGVGSFMHCPCCGVIVLGDGTFETAAHLAHEHVAEHQAARDGRLPKYPWSDGTYRIEDPTHGQHSHRLQWFIEQQDKPRTLIDRVVALNNAAAWMPRLKQHPLMVSELPAEAWSLPEEDA
jgi:hypothetical protein